MYKLLGSNLGEQDHISLSLAERDMPLFAKVANKREFPDEVDEAIKGLVKKKGHSYLLVTGMGNGEVWGSNNNADYFPTEALLGVQNTPTKWGSVSYEVPKDERLDPSKPPKSRYKTFEDADFFHHHRNKKERDPSYGRVLRSVWFPKMGTVLLLLEIDNKRDPESAEAIARGTPLAFSMGCKVPYDVCSICGNKATNLMQYCDHLRNQKNRILPDGRRVFAVNLHPRFFDISKVTKPAFLAGMQLQKVASTQIVETEHSVELADIYGIAAFDKLACGPRPETGSIPSHMLDAIERVSALEKEISIPELKEILGKCKGSIRDALGAFAYKGIVLTPKEYAALVFLAAGDNDRAEKVHSSDVALNPNPVIPETQEATGLAEPSVGHVAQKACECISNSTVRGRSIDTVEDRVYDSTRTLGKTAEILTEPRLGLGAVLTGLYMMYRDKIKEHPRMSAAIGAALAYGLLKSTGDPLLYRGISIPSHIGNHGPTIEQLNKEACFIGAYLSQSNLSGVINA